MDNQEKSLSNSSRPPLKRKSQRHINRVAKKRALNIVETVNTEIFLDNIEREVNEPMPSSVMSVSPECSEEENSHNGEFAERDEDTDGAIPMAIISSSWVVELGGNLYCYWPNYFKSDLHKDKAIQNHTPLSLEKCSQCPIVVKYSTNDYQKAMGKLQRLENNLESETESEMKKRKHKKKFILNMKMTTDNICPQNSGTPTTKEKSFSSCKGCEENKALLNELLRRMESMREDIKYLMKLATKNENVQVFVEEFPQFEEIEDINKFNEELSDEKVFVNACTKFQLVGGKDMYETTRKILALLISHKLALSMNWSGRNEKGGFKTLTNIIKLIHVSVRKNPLAINATLSDIENVIKVWLRNAADREGGRSKRK
ncbi:hypothetical protein JTB14_028757 [Gonioctena quinquepunctata]|nr:hypothetical protein JTB14_028757 [Gonioctena quinquepunctata]